MKRKKVLWFLCFLLLAGCWAGGGFLTRAPGTIEEKEGPVSIGSFVAGGLAGALLYGILTGTLGSIFTGLGSLILKVPPMSIKAKILGFLVSFAAGFALGFFLTKYAFWFLVVLATLAALFAAFQAWLAFRRKKARAKYGPNDKRSHFPS